MEQTIYDVIILGSGPAGLSAGIYAGRSRLNTLILEKGMPGGQITATDEIENYPGQLLQGENGFSLVMRMMEQAEKFGAKSVSDEITSVELEGNIKVLKSRRKEYRCKALIIAAGAHPKPIGCENEAKFTGHGISFCATCDAAFFQGLEVFVVGGGDSAVEEAMYLTKFARKVTVIHRRDQLRAAKSIQEKAFANPKLHFLWNSVVTKADGEDVLNAITVRNVLTGEETVIRATEEDGMLGLFGFVGYQPNTSLFEGKLPLENGYIRTDENMCTSIPGVYAAGDIRVKRLRQVITAAADGAIAAMQAEHDLSNQ